MVSTIDYSKSPNDGVLRLQIKNGVDENAKFEILKGEYDLLWLYSGNFEAMRSVDLSGLSVTKIYIQSTEPQDVSWVSELTNIETLRLNGKLKGKINFSELKKLKYCELDWCGSTKGVITSGLSLDSLSLSMFSGSLEDFNEHTAMALSTFGLTGPLESLNGIGRFAELKNLSIWNMKRLQNISELPSCKQLKCLQIETCNKIEYENVLKRLNGLEEIYFENKELASLQCFPKEKLKKIVLGAQTRILDCDVESILQFPRLEKVTFTKKKGYRYSAEDLNGMLKR